MGCSESTSAESPTKISPLNAGKKQRQLVVIQEQGSNLDISSVNSKILKRDINPITNQSTMEIKKNPSKKIFNPYEYQHMNTISSVNNPQSDLEMMTTSNDVKRKTSQRSKKFRASDNMKEFRESQ